MSKTINNEEFLDELDDSIHKIVRELSSFNIRFPPGMEEGIKMYALIGVKMALEHVREAAARSKQEVNDESRSGLAVDETDNAGRTSVSDTRRVLKLGSKHSNTTITPRNGEAPDPIGR